MNKEFIPYKQALALKELGFDERTLTLWHKDKTEELITLPHKGILYGYSNSLDEPWISAPLYQQAFRWFRDKLTFRHNISIYIKWDKTDYTYEWVIENLYNIPYVQNGFDTYEEAEQACLDKLIQLLKDGK